jgi:hypothetical protein
MLASGQVECGGEPTVGHSVDVAFPLFAATPLFMCASECQSDIRTARKDVHMSKIKIAGSQGQVMLKIVPSGSFSVRTARSSKLACTGVRSSLLLARSSSK